MDGEPEHQVGDGALKATMGVEFVERDGKTYMIFDAGMGPKLVYVSVGEIPPQIIRITT